MNYKPYSLEWSRRRYLAEAIQQYFDTDASLDTVLEDILSVLEENVSHHKSRAERFQEVINGLKSWGEPEISNIEKETREDWNGYLPGSEQARQRGCICPDQPNSSDVKEVNIDCPIHGRKSGTKWEMNKTPLKWNNDYSFVPAPPES